MKPTISKRRDITGRKIVGYTATIGPITETARDASTAGAMCWDSTRIALERLDEGTRVTAWTDPSGRVRSVVVAPTVAGWGYWLDFLSSPLIGGSYACAFDAELSALQHLAQNAWHAEVDDRAFLLSLPAGTVRSKLHSWIRFQRAYLRERAAGTPEYQIHQIACDRPVDPILL